MPRKLTSYLLLVTGSIAIGSALAISEKLCAKYIDSWLPATNTTTTFNRPSTIEFYSSKGEIIQKLGPITRSQPASGRIPEIIKQAFIAAEDRRFYKHNGVDFRSISRATLKNIKARSVVEGGSTITQQLARIIFLSQERTLERKLKEIFLAFKLEKGFPKNEISEQYLNNVYLGSNAYGVSNASWIYFTKTPDLLTLEEAALIAGLAPAPSLYSPLVNSNLALKRRANVLKKMKLEGFISNTEFTHAHNSPLILKPASPKYLKSKAPFFTTYVEQELPYLLSKEQIEIGGLKIRTSLSLDWQAKAQKIISNQTPHKLEGALVSIEPNTGLIRVLIGGKD